MNLTCKHRAKHLAHGKWGALSFDNTVFDAFSKYLWSVYSGPGTVWGTADMAGSKDRILSSWSSPYSWREEK